MSQNQPLTAPQLKELKDLLLERRRDFKSQMVQNLANLTPSENTAGSVSQNENASLANQTREVDAALTSLDELELARIDRALDAMEEGSYGRCDECGCHIPFERLRIEPMTQHCVACKSKWEKESNPLRR
ncbi:MAG: TraR/DksA C4-type zinc finger protein [Ottowia sp.]|uniref:TraR/DksA family transcriptional regulator n=1 Tax=unclassified Ottowia TaxID=2645081 RepID=UPI003C2B091B